MATRTYRYQCKNGFGVTRDFDGEPPRTITAGKKLLALDTRWGPGRAWRRTSMWPLHSNALAVNQNQRASFERRMSRLGVPTETDAKGRAIFRDRGHRNAALRAVKWFDHDGGYGDVTP